MNFSLFRKKFLLRKDDLGHQKIRIVEYRNFRMWCIWDSVFAPPLELESPLHTILQQIPLKPVEDVQERLLRLSLSPSRDPRALLKKKFQFFLRSTSSFQCSLLKIHSCLFQMTVDEIQKPVRVNSRMDARDSARVVENRLQRVFHYFLRRVFGKNVDDPDVVDSFLIS